MTAASAAPPAAGSPRLTLGRLVVAAAVILSACSARPAASASLHASGWQVIPDPFGPGVSIDAVAPGDGHPWIAVGASGGGNDSEPETRALVSDDARTWRRYPLVADDRDGLHTRLLSVGRLGDILVVAGVAVGALHGNLRPTLWQAPSGHPLSELNLPRELFGGPGSITFDGLATGPLGAFAAGTYLSATNQAVAQVWHSQDGFDWQRLDGMASMTSTANELLAGRAVAVGPRRVVMVGAAFALSRFRDGDDGAAWWSDDGRRWNRAPPAGSHMAGPGDQELRKVVAVDRGGFLAGGSDGAAAALWWTADGIGWRRADRLPGGRGGRAAITALASAGGRQWAAGVVGGSARLWSSSDGQHWAAEPLPASTSVTGVQAVTMAAGGGRLMVVVQLAGGAREWLIPLPGPG